MKRLLFFIHQVLEAGGNSTLQIHKLLATNNSQDLEGRRSRGEREIFGSPARIPKQKVLVDLEGGMLLCSLSIFIALLLTFVTAQSPQDAINLASSHPAFAKGLEDRPGWSANAYDTKSRYEIWRVEFYDAEGNGVGWADVNLEQQHLYAWDAAFDVIEGQYAEAEQVLIDFLRNDETSQKLIGSVDDVYGWWVGYDSWREVWMVHLDRGADSLDLTLRSRSSQPKSFESLYLEKVYVANIMSYGDWQNANGSQVVALAFENPEVAAAVRGKDWTTSTERLEGDAWKVRFLSGEQVIVEADVNLADSSVANIAVMQ
jgi:hypothetical protein